MQKGGADIQGHRYAIVPETQAWQYQLFAHGLKGNDGFDQSGGAEGVAVIGFEAIDRDSLQAGKSDRFGLHFIIVDRGGAMGRDEAYVAGSQAGFRQ